MIRRRPARAARRRSGGFASWAAFAVAAAPLAVGAPAACAQDPGPLASVVIALPEAPADVLFFDDDGDGRGDLLTLAPGPAAIVRRDDGAGGYEAARVRPLPADVAGVLCGRDPGGRPALLCVSDAGAAPAPPFDAGRAVAPPAADAPPAPPLLGFASDLDGDGRDDLAWPTADGVVVLLGDGARAFVRPPTVFGRVRSGGGMWSETRSRPRLEFVRLGADAARRPAWFEDGALRVLRGGFAEGFGPAFDERARFAPAGATASFERNEALVRDFDGDGAAEAALVRTRTEPGAATGAKTEFVVRKLDRAGPPLQALLLPGVLSHGPELREVDGDGRLDLVLSVFGDDWKSQAARGLRGSVRLTYYVYRGVAGPTPFGRTPAVTLVDEVPAADFDRWPLRHRLVFDADWTGDGKPDLLAWRVVDGATSVSVRPGVAGAAEFAFAERPVATTTLPFAATDFRPWSPGNGPAVLVRGADRVAIVRPAPRAR